MLYEHSPTLVTFNRQLPDWLVRDFFQIIASSLCVGVIAAYHSGIGGGGFLLYVFLAIFLKGSIPEANSRIDRVRFQKPDGSHEYEEVNNLFFAPEFLFPLLIPRLDRFQRDSSCRKQHVYVYQFHGSIRVYCRGSRRRCTGRTSWMGIITSAPR
jgi:hypothetical protein